MKFKEWLLGAPQKAFDLPAQEKGSTEGWLPVADIRNGVIPVSYTHLTLPTTERV